MGKLPDLVINKLLFELLKLAVLSQGGDGSAIVITQKYEELSNKFLDYENKLEKPYFIVKNEYTEGTIVISPNDEFSQEECIVFSCDVGIKAHIFYDLLIIENNNGVFSYE